MSLNEGQQRIYDAITKTNRNVCVAGSAGGTGKSYLLKKLQEDCGNDTLFMSTTGVSAIQLGGITVHSGLSLPLGFPTPEDLRKVSGRSQNLFKGGAVKRIVIDECGMLNVSAMHTIFRRIERFSKRLGKGNKIQLVIMGDILQLGSILNGREKVLCEEHIGATSFWRMPEFQEQDWLYMNLTEVVRQSDEEFKHHLFNIRKGTNLQDSINWFNDRCYNPTPPKKTTIMSPTNARVDTYNARVYDANPSQGFKYTAEVKGNFSEREYPVAYEVRMKAGLRVMTLRNDTEEGRWVNGSTGEVQYCHADGVDVLFDHSGECHTVEMADYDKYAYDTVFNPELGEMELSKRVEGTYKQVPLRQCDAITIHKSQGATLQNAVLNLSGYNGWGTGLVYVALSRLVSTEGLHLTHKLTPNQVTVDWDAVRWLEERLTN